MSNLFIEIKYDLRVNHYDIKTNVKSNKVEEIINTFLRSQINKGEDTSEPNPKDIYTFKIEADLSSDVINIIHDTGNESLREGILMNLINQLEHNPEWISWECD